MLAAIHFVFLTNTFSLLVAAQGPLIPIADCDNAAVVSAASILSSYSPALAYCSKAVPQPVSLVTRTRTSLVADDATVTETTTVGHAAATVTVTVDVATETTLAIQPPETETRSARLTTTVISTALQVNRRAFPTDIPFAEGGHGGHRGHGGQAHHGGSFHHGGRLPVHEGGGGGYGGHQGYQVQPIPDTEAAAELAYLQASSADLLTSVCSCIEDSVTSTVTTTDVQLYTHTATVTVSNDPRETATITKLETFTRHDISSNIALTTATITSTVVVTEACQVSGTSNLIQNGGFDEGDAETEDFGAWRVGNDIGFGTSLFRQSSGLPAISPPNFAGFPVDLPGYYMHLYQTITGIDVGAQHTLTFWYRPGYIKPAPFFDQVVVPAGACHLDVSWGDVPVTSLAFDKINGTNGVWTQYTYDGLVQLDAEAALQFYYHCDLQWFGDGYGVSYLDSVAIFPSDDVVCA